MISIKCTGPCKYFFYFNSTKYINITVLVKSKSSKSQLVSRVKTPVLEHVDWCGLRIGGGMDIYCGGTDIYCGGTDKYDLIVHKYEYEY